MSAYFLLNFAFEFHYLFATNPIHGNRDASQPHEMLVPSPGKLVRVDARSVSGYQRTPLKLIRYVSCHTI